MGFIIDYEIENEIVNDLHSDEKLIWTDRPKQGIIFRKSDIFIIPFTLMWGGFAIFWETTVIVTNAPLLFKLWGIPFVIVGLYLMIGRFFEDARRRKHTFYGMTKNRILIKSGILKSEIKSMDINLISEITFNERSDKSGSILLGTASSISELTHGINWSGIKHAPRLELIDDVRSVYEKIIDLQQPKNMV